MNKSSDNQNLDMVLGSINKLHETESAVEVEWKIEDFLLRLKNDWTIASPSFSWSSQTWELQMEFNSSREIRLFLYMYKTGLELSVAFKFSIRLMDGTVEMRCYLSKRFNDSVNGFGTQELILKSEMVERKHELFSEGSLIISCTISHLGTLTKSSVIKYEKLDTLSSNLKALFDSSKTSDFSIIVGEHVYNVHKSILAARSDVFAAMLEHEMTEKKSSIIKVIDCDPISFKDFLLFLYTGKIENFSSNNVCHLYRTADKYSVNDLKFLCLKYMKGNMSVTNLFDFVLLAQQFNETELISVIQGFFNKNSLEIIKEDAWESFVKQHFSIGNQLLMKMLENVKIEK